MVTQSDEVLAEHRRRQAELYGEPLGELIGRVADRLGLTRARVADVLGLSAPMISQLMSAQRIKIGNPLVVRRLQDLIVLADDAASGALPPDVIDGRIADIRAQSGTATTDTTGRRTGATGTVCAIQGLLRAAASADELLAAAETLRPGHPELAEFLRVYGAGRTDEAVAHFRAREHLL